jgi:hypothetical protein
LHNYLVVGSILLLFVPAIKFLGKIVVIVSRSNFPKRVSLWGLENLFLTQLLGKELGSLNLIVLFLGKLQGLTRVKRLTFEGWLRANWVLFLHCLVHNMLSICEDWWSRTLLQMRFNSPLRYSYHHRAPLAGALTLTLLPMNALFTLASDIGLSAVGTLFASFFLGCLFRLESCLSLLMFHCLSTRFFMDVFVPINVFVTVVAGELGFIFKHWTRPVVDNSGVLLGICDLRNYV